MLHMAGLYSAVADAAVYATVSAIVDNSLSISSNNRFIMPRDMRVVGAAAMSDAITAARINAPSLRNIAYPEIYPTNVSATPVDDFPLIWYGNNGPKVQQGEEVGVDMSRGTGTVDTGYAFLWLQDKYDAPPQGQTITITATATIVYVLGSWVPANLTFSQTLPSGRYAVTGFTAYGTNFLAARLIFPGDNTYRPGIVNGATYGNSLGYPFLRAGYVGLMGTFVNTSQPMVEGLGTTAGSQTLNMLIDLVKIG